MKSRWTAWFPTIQKSRDFYRHLGNFFWLLGRNNEHFDWSIRHLTCIYWSPAKRIWDLWIHDRPFVRPSFRSERSFLRIFASELSDFVHEVKWAQRYKTYIFGFLTKFSFFGLFLPNALLDLPDFSYGLLIELPNVYAGKIWFGKFSGGHLCKTSLKSQYFVRMVLWNLLIFSF